MLYSRRTIRPRCSAVTASRTNTNSLPASRLFILLLALLLAPAASVHADLDINEAVRLALTDDPVIAANQARSQALGDNAIADGQLPDPQLRTGIYNLPTDNFHINEEPSTQLRLGLQQAFPRGKTLHYKQRQGEWKATAAMASAELGTRQAMLDVRRYFLELYYQTRAGEVVRETRKLFSQLVDITQAHYATGRVSQQDVLNASLELSRLDDRTTRILNAVDTNRAALMKWIGNAASLPVNSSFPELPLPASREQIEAALPGHPVIQIETAKLEAENQSIQIAREQYKPGWSAGLEYRKRFGEDPNGDDRSDMMAAMVTVDIPLFTKNRQDKRLSASIQQASSVQLGRDDKLRELKRQLDTDYANWQRLEERAALYKSQLLQASTANAQASLNAYQSGVTEFTTLMRARITDLDVRLADLRIRVDRAIAQASLLYLAGENP
ncbi:MAG: TolC family protein [Gammaproteobacteria bacterium]|nr:TolC family protein [Gammaproteobacteria bacterium]